MLEKCWEYNINVYLAFTVFRQTYDSVRRKKIREALQHFQITNKLIKLVEVTMDNMAVKVQVQAMTTELSTITDDLNREMAWHHWFIS
jgi:predicted RNA-binding protein with EMAP domain